VVNFNYVSSPKFVQNLPLAYQRFRSFFIAFHCSNKQHMGSLYATTCKTDCLQILYKFCKNWISVPNIVHQLTLSLRCNHWKIQNRGDSHDAINSIRRSAAERLQANDVSLLWRHSSRSRSWQLEHANRRAIFDSFWGIWTQKCCRPSREPPKGTSLRHNAYF